MVAIPRRFSQRTATSFTMQAPCVCLNRTVAPQSISRQVHAASTAVRAAPQPTRASIFKCTRMPSMPSAATRVVSRRHVVSVRAAATAEVGKLISQVEIPSFIPRPDLLEQLVRWSLSSCQLDGAANFGMPMRIEPFHNSKGDDWGFIVSMVRDGVTLTQIGVMFDEEVTTRNEWVGKGADGFPVLEGKVTEVIGQSLIIRKMDDNPVDEELRASIRSFCESLVSALNKYYAFGSCFTDDYT